MESANVLLFRNRILASLPAPEVARLAPHLSPRVFRRNQTLYDAGQAIESVYFLEDGVCSLMVAMENGGTVEVGVVGSEGFVGMAGLMGAVRSPNRCFIEIAGSGYAVKAKTLAEQYVNSSSQLRLLLQQGIQGLLAQIVQTAACNRVHELEERLARSLLMCRDRMQADDLPVTHESLAMMLGTRRSSVTVSAGILQKAGLIEYSHGHVRIEDRKGLEKAACECYSVIHEEYVRLGLFSEPQRPKIPPASVPHRGVVVNGSNSGKYIGGGAVERRRREGGREEDDADIAQNRAAAGQLDQGARRGTSTR
jgi:CRP-like cAMP-binding protein